MLGLRGRPGVPRPPGSVVTSDKPTPVTCWLCGEVIPEDEPGNVRPIPRDLLKLFCDDCVDAVDLYILLTEKTA